MDNKEIGKKIKFIRELNNFTQKKLAEVLGYSEPQISHLENGSRTVSVKDLQKISELFKVPYDYFLPRKTLTSHFRASKTELGSEILDQDIWEDFKRFANKKNE